MRSERCPRVRWRRFRWRRPPRRWHGWSFQWQSPFAGGGGGRFGGPIGWPALCQQQLAWRSWLNGGRTVWHGTNWRGDTSVHGHAHCPRPRSFHFDPSAGGGPATAVMDMATAGVRGYIDQAVYTGSSVLSCLVLCLPITSMLSQALWLQIREADFGSPTLSRAEQQSKKVLLALRRRGAGFVAEIRIRGLGVLVLALLIAGSTKVSLARNPTQLGYHSESYRQLQLFGKCLSACVPTMSRSQMTPS